MGERSIMREPADQLLSHHGIRFKTSTKGATTWFNLEWCPVCEHKDFQCGVSEKAGNDSKLVHGFKCQHTDVWRYEEFLNALGSNLPPAPNPFLAQEKPSVSAQPTNKQIPFLNLEANGRYRKRLIDHAEAFCYLADRGLTLETIEYFKLGLSNVYERRTDKKPTGQALTYPMIFSCGKFYAKNGYYNIPGVTLNPLDKNGWMKGDIQTYYSGTIEDRKKLMICEGAKDLWRVYQEIRGTDLDIELLLITSTHGKALPDTWFKESFWQEWDQVFLGHDNDAAGHNMAKKVAERAVRDTHRVQVPEKYGKDWTDFFQNGGTLEEFRALLNQAPVTAQEMKADDLSLLGRMAYDPVDINGAYHNGHLYYTAQTLLREKIQIKLADGSFDDQVVETKENVVVRSDGRVLEVQDLPSRPGSKRGDQVLRLSDGTLIEKPPIPSPYATWSWPSILRYQSAKAEGRSISVRPLALLYEDVRRYLKNKVWLQHKDDYTVLALAAIATYVQPVFAAVPLFLANGPKGSGKTEIGRAMCDVSANATMIGQASAATIARLIDMTRGFVVLDDLESAGKKKDEQFGELVQALKLSYKQLTAVKVWTDVKTMQVEKLNFYGIKMINNTSGVDAILGSRMMTIQTRKRLPSETELWESNRDADVQVPKALRDELHTWASHKVKNIERAYQSIYSQGMERSDEIAAPLRTLAAMTGNDLVAASLERALDRQLNQPRDFDEPEDLLEDALRNLVKEGFAEVSAQHLILEMRRIAPENFGIDRTTDIPVWAKPEWIGRVVRSQGWVDTGGSSGRFRFLGMQWRSLNISDAFISDVIARAEQENEEIQPASSRAITDFCAGCSECPYRNVGCDIQARRMEADKKGQVHQIGVSHASH